MKKLRKHIVIEQHSGRPIPGHYIFNHSESKKKKCAPDFKHDSGIVKLWGFARPLRSYKTIY